MLNDLTLGRVSSTGFVPVGAVIHFSASSAPAGYLKANGAIVTNGVGTVQGITANFSALFAIVGTTYGTAGTLPDLRGQFIRGWADSTGTTDAGRVFGSAQADSFKSHTHGVSIPDYPIGGSSFGFSASASSVSSDVLTTSATGSTETRPLNVALLACIKY